MLPNDHPERRHRPDAQRPDPRAAEHRTNGPDRTDETSDEPDEMEQPGELDERDQLDESEGGSAVRRATGREREEWFALLDAWDAPAHSSREITAWLTDEHELSGWWAQKLRVTYQQERGITEPGQRADGSFAATASKTIGAGAAHAFEAVVDPARRERWLPDAGLRLRSSRPASSARFDGTDDSRVVFDFRSTGPDRCTVAVEHRKLADSAEAERLRAYWRERLTVLRQHLEHGD